MKKYNIVCVHADYMTMITETHLYHSDALESLSRILKEYTTEEKKRNFRVYFENPDELTINYYGWSGKSLYSKYFIIAFEDNTDINKSMDIIKSKL